MKTNLIIILFSFLFTISCTKEPFNEITYSSEVDSRFTQFTFQEEINAENLLKDIKCQIIGNNVIGILPYVSGSKILIASFETEGVVTVNGVEQRSGITSNDFSKPVTYTIVGGDGVEKSFTVTLYSFTGLPVLYLQTDKPVTSKDDYVGGNVVIDPNSRYVQETKNIKLKMKGRGNSTWDMPKKPYKLKLDVSTEILGMPAAKEWVLLANFADKTLMRNYLAFEMAKQFNVNFTPRSRYVEVFLNGEHIGNYLLTEQIQIGTDRVNIKPMSKTDLSPETITGGFLLEIDERLDEPFWFRTTKQVPVTIKEPEKITTEQFAYIKDYIQKTEDAIYSHNFTDPEIGYTNYIDVNSFINWYLVNELMKNNDAAFYSSVYMYKDRNGKLSLGPVWDFDIAAGNINFNGNNVPEGWWIRKSLWMNRLFEDPAFRRKVKERWMQLKKSSIPQLYSLVNETNTYLKYSQRQNFKKWDVLYNQTWPNAVVLGTYENEVQYMKDWLAKRVKWLDGEFLSEE